MNNPYEKLNYFALARMYPHPGNGAKLVEYNEYTIRCKVKCDVCGSIFNTTFKRYQNKSSSCPNCRKLTSEAICTPGRRIGDYKVLGLVTHENEPYYANKHMKCIKLQCTKCGRIIHPAISEFFKRINNGNLSCAVCDGAFKYERKKLQQNI